MHPVIFLYLPSMGDSWEHLVSPICMLTSARCGTPYLMNDCQTMCPIPAIGPQRLCKQWRLHVGLTEQPLCFLPGAACSAAWPSPRLPMRDLVKTFWCLASHAGDRHSKQGSPDLLRWKSAEGQLSRSHRPPDHRPQAAAAWHIAGSILASIYYRYCGVPEAIYRGFKAG